MIIRKFSMPFVVIASVLTALVTLRAFPLGLDLAFPTMSHQISNAKILFILHITASPLGLMLGSIQMLPNFRKRHLNIHRWVGRTYAVAVLVGGVSGLLMAFQIDKLLAALGFALLAVLWLFITAQAVRLARARRFSEHRRWMICSFALTFAAVTLRLQLLTFTVGFAMPYEQVYPFLAWSAWVPNIAFALWYLRRNPNPYNNPTS